jgi:hypothetical protein
MEPSRFVVLRHEPGVAGPSELHWDLMFETGGSLRTWALQSEPCVGEEILADELPRHRLSYLEYEGTISNGRGTVHQFDRGSYTVVRESPQQLTVDLHGEILNGRLQLTWDSASQRWTVWLMPN